MSVYKTKSGRWGVIIDLERGANGKRAQKKLGTHRTKALAQAAEREALSDKARGIDLSPAEITVGELVTRYIENRCALGRGRKTLQEYRGKYRLYIKPHLGTIQVARLSRAMVSSWVARLTQSGGTNGRPIGPKSVQHAYGLLSASLAWGITLDLVATNACVGVETPPVPRTSVTATTAVERDAMSDVAESSRWAYFVALSFVLGTRRGETVALNRSDVDFERGEVTVSKSMSDADGEVFVVHTKTDRERLVPVGPEELAIFRKQFAQQAADRLRAGAKYVGNLTDPDCPIFTDELGAGSNRWPRRRLTGN